MLAIRMQRTGRKGHAQFRVIVQDSRFSPKSGRVVAYVGNYDPHTKVSTIDKDKISGYMTNGAVPSERVAKLLTKEGVKLPAWYKVAAPKNKDVRFADKRRSTRPEEPAAPQAEAPVEETTAEVSPAEETVPTPETEAPDENAEPEAQQSELEAPAEAPEPEAKESATSEPEAEAKSTEETAPKDEVSE